MTQRQLRFTIAACATIALGFASLGVLQVVENYPAPDGLIIENGELVGGDFLAFWIGGHVYQNDRERLYDLPYQFEVRRELLGTANDATSGELPFVYPPLVAAVMAPLSRLPLQTAFSVFAVAGLLFALAALFTLARSLGWGSPVELGFVALFSLGFMPFGLDTVLGGQVSWLGIVILSLVTAAVMKGRNFTAGVLMSLSYYKPPLFLLLLLALLLSRGRRFAQGFALGAAVLVALTLLAVGLDGARAYLSIVSRYTYGQELTEVLALPVSSGMGFVALVLTFLGSMKWTLALLMVPFVLVGVAAARGLRQGDELRSMTLLTTATLAFSIQFIKYDLALLLVPMVLLTTWQKKESTSPSVLVWLASGAFYFEFLVREIAIGGQWLNASWLLLVLLVGGLFRESGKRAAA